MQCNAMMYLIRWQLEQAQELLLRVVIERAFKCGEVADSNSSAGNRQ